MSPFLHPIGISAGTGVSTRIAMRAIPMPKLPKLPKHDVAVSAAVVKNILEFVRYEQFEAS